MIAVAIIQARITSTRLHSKALKKLSGIPMISHVIERTKLINGIGHVILATGTGSENSVLLDIAKHHSIASFAGSENNVLDRFYQAAKNIESTYIVRVTGDNPLTDYESAALAIDYAVKTGADHCNIAGIPTGTGVEVIKKTALAEACKKADKPYQYEHVTPFIKEHPELFLLATFTSQLYNPYPDLRLTVDTEEDFILMQRIYSELYRGHAIILPDVIRYIADNPDLRLINNSIEQRPMTHSSNG